MCWQLAKLASLNIDRSDVPKDRAFTSLRLVRAKMAAKMTAKMAAKMTAKWRNVFAWVYVARWGHRAGIITRI